MAATTPIPEPPTDDVNVGTFVSSIAMMYLEPSQQDIKGIEAAVTSLAKVDSSLLKELITIKLLAPQESQELRIYNIPQALALIKKISAALIENYHRGS